MYCKHCGNKVKEGAKFCTSCGKGIHSNSDRDNTVPAAPHIQASASEGAIIKCGNCGYEGSGEKARNVFFVILAWLCVVFAPLITIIYFVATAKWRCPKCKSTFLGVKNKEGKFNGQRSSNATVIIVAVLAGIAVIGILSSIVLASLNSARIKGRDARRVADVKQLQLALELYYDANHTYPTSLNLLSSQYMNEVPVDPAGGSYHYSLCAEDSYHLGASLEQETHPALSNDADNVNICVGDNVNGDDSKKCSPSDVGNYCYDVTPWAG